MTATSIQPGLVLASMILGGAAVAGPVDLRAELPPSLSQRPAADTCQALRSATYRIVSPTLGGTLADQTSKVQLDATTLTITRPDGGRGSWEALGNCHFVDPGADGLSIDYVVSQAGVLVGRITVNGGSSYRTVLGFPEQAHSLAELAGSWNILGFRSAVTGLYVDGGSVSYSPAGAIIAATECSNPASWAVDACSDVPGAVVRRLKPYAEDAAGGFVSKTGTRTSRLFIYRAGAGRPMMVEIGNDGAFFLATPVEALVAPSVGRTTVTWNLDMTSRLESATSTYVSSATVVGVDTRPPSWTRVKRTPGSSDEHRERMLINSPRSGYLTRPAGEALTRGGSTVRFNQFTNLPLPGMGLFAVVLPAIKLFEIAVLQP